MCSRSSSCCCLAAATACSAFPLGRAVNRGSSKLQVQTAFYEGEVADQISRFVRAQGGFMTMEDLGGFRAEVAPAPHRRFRNLGGLEVHVPPPQWSQGPALLQILAILEHFELKEMGHNSVRYLHVILEAVKLAFSDRERHYGESSTTDVSELLGDEHARELAAMIQEGSAIGDLPTMRHRADDILSTTHIAVLDSRGNAFAASPSDTLAMGPVVPGLGIVVSGRGVQSRTDPAHPAALGPLKRPRVTPSPAIAIDPDGMAWSIACPGGDVIVQAMLQALLNVVVFGMTEQQAVEAPRATSLAFPNSFYPHSHPKGMVVVETRVPGEVLDGLEAIGHDVREWPPYEFEAGSVGMVRQHLPSQAGRTPTLHAGADPRRAAYALGR
jgi:gamma-glutamyltranspeptidase/glutathione hydrolase